MCGTTVDTQGNKMSDACNKVSIETSFDLSSSLAPIFVFNMGFSTFYGLRFVFITLSKICFQYLTTFFALLSALWGLIREQLLQS